MWERALGADHPILVDPDPAANVDVDVDAQGYATQGSNVARYNDGVTSPGVTTSKLILSRLLNPGSSFTFFVLGSDTPDFPLELMACDETQGTGALASCSDAPPQDVLVDTIDVELSGAYVLGEAERRPKIAQAFSQLTSDIVCVTEAYRQSDKDAIIAAAKGRFPYVYYPKADRSTPFSDTTDINGTPQSNANAPACAADVANMNAQLDCSRDHCSTKAGSEDATVIPSPSERMSAACTGPGAAVIGGPAHQCFACLVNNLGSHETIGNLRTFRSTNVQGGLTFGGQAGEVILSRLPTGAAETFYCPKLLRWQAEINRAVVTLDHQATVDFDCGATSSVTEDCTLFPTLSPWGAGATTCKDSSVNEQRNMVVKLRDLVRSRSAGAKAIIAADLYLGPAYRNVLNPVYPDHFGLMSAAFSLGLPPGQAPQCTYCSANPDVSLGSTGATGLDRWTRATFLFGIPVTAVKSWSTFLRTPTVSVTTSKGPLTIPPMGRNCPVRSRIRIAP